MPGRKTPKTDLLVTWLRVVFYCRAYFAFKDCIFKIPLSSECPDDHLLSSVREHSAYLTSVMDGFDFLQCECKSSLNSVCRSGVLCIWVVRHVRSEGCQYQVIANKKRSMFF